MSEGRRLSKPKNRGDVIGPPGLLRENRLETKIERNLKLVARRAFGRKSREEQTTSAPPLHKKISQIKHRWRGEFSEREREKLLPRHAVGAPDETRDGTKNQDTASRCARKSNGRTTARGRKISTAENPRRGVCRALARFPEHETGGGPGRRNSDEETSDAADSPRRTLVRRACGGKTSHTLREIHCIDDTGRREACVLRPARRTLWAKSTSGKRTETQIQATRAAAHEEKNKRAKKGSKGLGGGANQDTEKQRNPSAARNPRKQMAARGWKNPMLPTLALQPWAGPQYAREEPEIDEKNRESITEKSTRIIRPRPTLRIKGKFSDLAQTRHKMQTRNISLRSKQSLHPIHGGLRPPSLFFLIGTKIGTLQKLRTTK
jgi:hypothetical protein